MTFTPNVPRSGQSLGVTRDPIQNNFTNYNNVVSQDHVPPNASGQGKHNQVDTPAFSVFPAGTPSPTPPTTGGSDVIFYAFQQTSNVGLLQFSRGPNNSVPSPVTRLYSTIAAVSIANLATVNILDFTGINQAIFNAYAYDASNTISNNVVTLFWNGSAFITGSTSGARLLFIGTGAPVLRLQNTSGGLLSNVYWALEFIRIQ